jgi:uncharacterized protein YbjT (DUF2867 family)
MGATGFIGSRLSTALLGAGASVRCVVRDPSRAGELRAAGCEVRRGDVTDASSLVGIGEGIDVAYYLVHAMAGGAGFAEREQQGAVNFARAARREASSASSTSAASAMRASPSTCAAAMRLRWRSKRRVRR